MEHRLYKQAKITVWKFEENEARKEMHFQRKCDEIIRMLYQICEQLSLDFRDFRNAFLETGYFGEPKSFDRILNGGLPKKYVRNLKIFEDFLKNVDKALQNCADGTYHLKYSSAETIKKNYKSFPNLSNHLYQLAVFARRADPELSAKEQASIQIFIQEKAAKSFFDRIENETFEEIKDKNGCYFKVPKSVCLALYTTLKNDVQIMKRLNKKFSRKDYPPFE